MLQHVIEMGHHIGAGHTHNPEPDPAQIPIPLHILRVIEMLRPVHLHHQTMRVAHKVTDVGSERFLTSELGVEVTPQAHPQTALGIRHRPSQVTRQSSRVRPTREPGHTTTLYDLPGRDKTLPASSQDSSAPLPEPQSAVCVGLVGCVGRDKCPLTWENRVCEQPFLFGREGTVVVKSVSHNMDRIRVRFDDDRSVAAAGLLLPLTLGNCLGLPGALNRHVSGCDRRQRRNASDKAMTVISSLLAGGEFISDVSVLSSGATGRVLGHRVISGSRLGEWLRSLDAGDVEGLAAANRELVTAGWGHRLGPDLDAEGPLILDIDSTFIKTYGVTKEGTRTRDYLGRHGYQPLICAEASTGQVIAARLQDGNTAPPRDAAGFLDDEISPNPVDWVGWLGGVP